MHRSLSLHATSSMRMKYGILACLSLLSITIFAQPAYDDCANAIVIDDVANYCSEPRGFANVAATTSAEASGSCQLTGEVGSDVWFTFEAVGTQLSVRVTGATGGAVGGTLSNPELIVYQGSCGNLAEVGCNSDAFNNGLVSLNLERIQPGNTYTVRVSGRNGTEGSFRLCISSFNDVPDPNSDCPTGVVLCDKSAFVVDALSGTGEIQDEANGSCLGSPGENSERSSTWYKWVAGSDGTLSFVLTPNNPSDDLDFAVYELPNGLSDCTDKILLRCMASGEQGGCPTSVWEPCTGPTGLSLSSSDLIELPGCNVNHPCVELPTGQDDDNFIAGIDMEAGNAYALLVNNYTRSGDGFSISFGGTGEFLGPEANFSTDDPDGTLCFGEDIVFFDESSFGDLDIAAWQWEFGEGAVPESASGPGPHQVSYTTGGIKSIVLTIESETGCLISDVGTIIVEPPIEVLADIQQQSCPQAENGTISLDIESNSSITGVLWEHGVTGTNLQDLGPGTYEVLITNFNGCDTSLSYTLEPPQPLEIDQIITRPSCGGGSDGSITLVVDGVAPPYIFDFDDGNGFVLNNTRAGLPADVYDIAIQDANGCISHVTVPLGEVVIDVDPDFEGVTPPSCYGFADGRLEVRILGGDAGFAYDWNLNNNYVRDPFYDGVTAGSHHVRIRNDLDCVGFASFDVSQPDSLQVRFDTTNITCFGESDGTLTSIVSGGTPDYAYSWSTGGDRASVQGLGSGNYRLTITDANGCLIQGSAPIIEPPPLEIYVDSIRDVVCYGDQTGVLYLRGEGGTPGYTFGVDGGEFVESPVIEALTGGQHSVSIRDDGGCVITVDADIYQPDALIVDAGADTTVDLGQQAQLIVSHSPINKPVLYQWSPEQSSQCDSCPVTVVSPLQTTLYTVTITDEEQCTSTDSVLVSVYANRPVFIPNSITPDGDGFNDRLAVYGGVAVAPNGVRKLQVFDRWGEMVWEGNNLPLNDETLGWDGTHMGKPLNPGVFVYVAEVQFIDDSVLTFEGDITLIR